MLSLNDYFLQVGELIDASAATTIIIPMPDGGRLARIMLTEAVVIATTSDTATFSTVTAAGTAVAVTGGVGTLELVGTTVGRTLTTQVSKQSDGTDVVPPGGALKCVTGGASASGDYRIAVIMRR